MRSAGRTATAAILAAMTILASLGIVQYVDQPLPPGPTVTLAPTNTPGGPTNTPTATLASTATFTPMPTSTNTPGPTATATVGATATPSAAMSLGTLALHPTFNSIDVELPFDDGTSVTLSSVALEFKKTSDATWRDGLPLWPTRPNNTGSPTYQPAQPAAFGAVLLAEAGTAYDVRVTATGSDGSTLQATGSVTTKTDNIPAASAISGTVYYVNSASGDDSRSVTTVQTKATPWKTLRKAVQSVPAGAIIELAPGYYAEIETAPITKALTVRAEFPAVDDDRQPINEGNWSIIQDGSVTGSGASVVQKTFESGPAGSGATWEDAWVQDAALSATAGKTIWKLPGSVHGMNSSTINQMGFHQTRGGLGVRIMQWARKTSSSEVAAAHPVLTSTPDEWAAALASNKTYRYGFWTSGTAPYDLYLAPPPNMVDTTGTVTDDPNETWISMGGSYGVIIRAADVRLTGLVFRNMEQCVLVGSTSTGVATSTYNNIIFDHNLTSGCLNGFRMDSPSSPTAGVGLGSTGHVIQYNLFHDRTLWSDDFATDPGSPWVFTKEKLTRSDDSLTALARYGDKNEGAGLNMKNEGAKWVTVRFNTFDGPQNGFSMNGGVPSAPRDSMRGLDFHDNECVRIIDDCLEPEAASVNVKAWNNRMHKGAVALSTAPIHYGPLFFFRNEMWDMGAQGGAAECCGSRARVGTSAMMKGGALNLSDPTKAHVRPIIYFLHNTLWTDVDGSGPPDNSDVGSIGPDMTINGQGSYNAVLYLRNNLIRTTRYVARVGQGDLATNWDEDYNAMAARNSPEQSANIDFIGMRLEGGGDNGNSHQVYSSYSPSVRTVVSTSGYTLADYRADLAARTGRPAGYGNGAHTNKFGTAGADVAFASPVDGSGATATLDALLTDPEAGDLTLAAGTNPLVDAGVPVPNLSDRSGVDYSGAAPDIGATER